MYDSGKTKARLIDELRDLRARVDKLQSTGDGAFKPVSTAVSIADRDPSSLQQLAELEHLYRTAPVGLCLMDTELRYVRVNDRLAEMHGLAVGEHIGQRLRDVIPEVAKVVELVYHRVLETGEPQLDLETHVANPASPGEKMTCLVSYYPIKSEDGRILGISTVIQDITPRQRAEEALRVSEERYRTLAETARVIPWEADANTFQFTYVGGKAEEILGYRVRDWYTHSFWENHIHSEDRDWAVDYCVEHMKTCIDYQFDYRMIASDGSIVWLHDVVHVVRDEDGPRLLCGFMIDITERKAAEEALRISEKRYQTLARVVPVGIFRTDVEGNCLYVNERWCDITGLTNLEAIGQGWVAAIHPDDRPTVLEKWQLAIEQRRPFKGEYRFNHPEKGTTWVLGQAIAETNRRGHTVGFVGTVTDITERRRAEEESRQHLAELSHVARLSTMAEMATGLAHELNQPLTAIGNYAFSGRQVLEKLPKELKEPLKELCENISTQAYRAGEIIRRLRDLVRKTVSEKSLVDINSLVQEVFDLIEPEANLSEIPLTCNFGCTMPRVAVDPIQIQQVVLNLIKNALEATAESDAKLPQVTVETSHENGFVQVGVSDTGRGLPKENLEQIFDAFFTTKAEGMGFGLTISRSIIEAHGGRLWATSNTPCGATFCFTLPVGSDEKDNKNG